MSRLDTAALTLREACQIRLSLDGEDEDLRARVFQRISRAELAEAVETVGALSRPPEDHYYELLGSKYRTIRRFLPTLLRSIRFSGTEAARPVLDAIDFLKQLDAKPAKGRPKMSEAPLEVLTPAWRRHVLQLEGHVSRPYYTFSVLEQLRLALRRRDLFVPGSDTWGDPRRKLLEGAAWEGIRTQVCRSLGRALRPERERAALAVQLEAACRRTAEGLVSVTSSQVADSRVPVPP